MNRSETNEEIFSRLFKPGTQIADLSESEMEMWRREPAREVSDDSFRVVLCGHPNGDGVSPTLAKSSSGWVVYDYRNTDDSESDFRYLGPVAALEEFTRRVKTISGHRLAEV